MSKLNISMNISSYHNLSNLDDTKSKDVDEQISINKIDDSLKELIEIVILFFKK